MENEEEYFESQLFAFESYAQIIDRLQHFNKMQTAYRIYAFMWVVVTFIGIIYTLSPNEESWFFDRSLVVIFICLASCSGVFLLWYMDLMICERKIATALFQGYDYESKYEWIPKISLSSNIFHSLWGYVYLKTFFYAGIFAILVITFGVALTMYLKETSYWFIGPISSFCILFVICYILINITKNENPYIILQKIKESLHEQSKGKASRTKNSGSK
ncbi:MAG: hypothetical protein K2X39_04270 [Silvanigrellaceae bacterium]|nr:hypothetical protein [Silvanigrellaceae bacterium]